MKSHQSIALAGLILCSLLAVMLSSNLMATLQDQSVTSARNQPVSNVALAVDNAQAEDFFAPELPPLILSPGAQPLKRGTQSTGDSSPGTKAGNLSSPTTSFFRPLTPQFGSQTRSGFDTGGESRRVGQSGFSPQPDAGQPNDLPPVGINPPQFENTNRGNFSSGQDRSFENERGSFESLNGSASQSLGEDYYDRNRADSFAPPSRSNE